MDLNTGHPDFFSTPLETLSLQFTGPTSCNEAACSRYNLLVSLPDSTVWPDKSTNIYVNITVSLETETASYEVLVQSPMIPYISTLVPGSISVTTANSSKISIFIANGQTFCESLNSCQVLLQPIKDPAQILSSSLLGSIRILTILPPPLPYGSNALSVWDPSSTLCSPTYG